MGRQKKRAAHEWADLLTDASSRRAIMKARSDKYGEAFVKDWLQVHKQETAWARKMLRIGFNGLDTETTSVNDVAEICEIGIVPRDGKNPYETFIRPRDSAITSHSQEITGISPEMLKTAPKLAKVHAAIQKRLDSNKRVLIYNAEFDVRVADQSCFHAGLPMFRWPEVVDVLKHFSRWTGDWNAKFNDYSWPRLEGGHRAVGDVIAMISLMEKMTHRPLEHPDWNPSK